MASGSGQTYYKISCSFERDFAAPIREGLVTVGRFLLPADADVSSATALTAASVPPPALSLACASSGQRVIVHNNNTPTAAARRSAKHGEPAGSPTFVFSSDEAALHTLNFGKEATALAAGRLHDGASSPLLRSQDALLFGAKTSLLAYNVDQNKQLFYKEVGDGVQAVVWGQVSTGSGGGSDAGTGSPSKGPSSLSIVGGNCSIYGFDSTGTDRYWTVTGDQVTAMAMLPWAENSAGLTLMAASEDCEIRVFTGEEAVSSIMEVDRVRQLIPLWRPPAPSTTAAAAPATAKCDQRPAHSHFAYLLDNGTVGVYNKTERIWRVKGKSVPVSAAFCDVDCDGVPELVVGWRSGRLEVRSDLRAGSGNKGGEVLFRESYPAPVAAVLAEDYREDGRVLPIVCTVDGTVRGLTLLESQLEEAVDVREGQTLEALTQHKQALAAQLASLEEQLALKQKGNEDAMMPETGVVVRIACVANALNQKLDVVLSVHNGPSDVIIHSCVLFSDAAAAFAGEEDVIAFYADEPSKKLTCALDFPKDVDTTIRASVVVGTLHAESYQIHDMYIGVPRFMMYQMPHLLQQQNATTSIQYTRPSGYTTLTFKDPLRMAEIEVWLRQAFRIQPEHSLGDARNPGAPVLLLELVSARGEGCLGIEVRNFDEGTGERSVTIYSETLEVCGDVLAALDAAMAPSGGVAEGGEYPVSTRCEFPTEMQRLRDLLQRVEEANEVRMKFTSSMADGATVIKTLLIRAEDARLLGDITNMKKTYTSLFDVNRELMSDNAMRVKYYDDLKTALKEVNSYIQRAGKVRMGPAKAELIAACRNALKANKTTSLVDLIRTGSE